MSYRERRRACPACATPMDEVPARSDPADPGVGAQIDRCPRCAGLFLEFFDGEPSAISRGLRGRADVAPGPGSEPVSGLRCPDCESTMTRRRYLDDGPELSRCESCLAVFLTPGEVEELARLTLAPEEQREPSWLDRLLAWLPGR